MDLPWNLCPFCGTPTPGKRRENLTLDDALEPLAGFSLEETETPNQESDFPELGIMPEVDFEVERVELDKDPIEGDE